MRRRSERHARTAPQGWHRWLGAGPCEPIFLRCARSPRHLIADGFVCEVLSTTLVARGGAWWGGAIPEKKIYAYLLRRLEEEVSR